MTLVKRSHFFSIKSCVDSRIARRHFLLLFATQMALEMHVKSSQDDGEHPKTGQHSNWVDKFGT